MPKIVMQAPDPTASTWYRAVAPVMNLYQRLAAEGVNVMLANDVTADETADAYIIHRLVRKELWEFAHRMLAVGRRVVWECDDDLWNVLRSNPASYLITEADKAAAAEQLHSYDRLWVSTNHLAVSLGHPAKTDVLPNLVDFSHFQPVRPSQRTGRFPSLYTKPVRILWAGGNTHEDDLREVVEPVRQLLEEFDSRIQVVFWGFFPFELADCERITGQNRANLVPAGRFRHNLCFLRAVKFEEYFRTLADLRPDIAIAPLADVAFNSSKSNLKSLEMLMAGAAFIGSDLPPYRWLEDGRTGLLVAPGDANGWYGAVRSLIIDEERRRMLATAGREAVVAGHTWQSEGREVWLRAFLDLLAK